MSTITQLVDYPDELMELTEIQMADISGGTGDPITIVNVRDDDSEAIVVNVVKRVPPGLASPVTITNIIRDDV